MCSFKREFLKPDIDSFKEPGMSMGSIDLLTNCAIEHTKYD